LKKARIRDEVINAVILSIAKNPQAMDPIAIGCKTQTNHCPKREVSSLRPVRNRQKFAIEAQGFLRCGRNDGQWLESDNYRMIGGGNVPHISVL